MKDLMLNVNSLNCNGCPAQNLRNLDWIKSCEHLRRLELRKILEKVGRVKLFLLAESIPSDKFFYNLRSASKLRKTIMEEMGVAGAYELLELFRRKGVLLVDAALCPLHKLKKRSLRRQAATLCLERNTHVYLEQNHDAPIVTIFPRRCGALKRSKIYQSIKHRIIANLNFSKPLGLKDIIMKLNCN